MPASEDWQLAGQDVNCLLVHLAQLKLRDFRNYARLEQEFAPGFHLLLGQNAQGKTNLLEAIYLLATLRSFRGVGGAQMVRYGQKGYFAAGAVVGQETHGLKLYWSASQRRVALDDRVIRKLTDYFGVLRAVVFCTEDLQLVKGAGRIRRRFLDLLLAQTQPGYLLLLQRYARALRARNALLKQRGRDAGALDSFTHELVQCGDPITRLRAALVPRISPLAQAAYREVAGGAEPLDLAYQPSVRADFAVELAQSQERERLLRCTVVGPHRDELRLELGRRAAAQYASEGQKRTLAIALKLAQAHFLAHHYGAPPILLIDDVMGELDPGRRGAFLPLLTRAHETQGQVFMTCTQENWPRELGRELIRWEVNAGTLQPRPA